MIYIQRELESTITKYIRTREIIAVVGPRQCGKTTLMHKVLERLKNVNMISFDDVKALELFEKDIDTFIELNVKGYDYLFIDEVQYAKDSGKKLKYIYDTHYIKLFISGSSATDISIRSIKYLVGRIFVFKLFPFSFKEYLLAKNSLLVSIYDSGKISKEILQELNKHLQDFIIYGGYPGVVLAETTEQKELVLKNIYNTYLLREIKEILELSGNDKLIILMKSLSLQTGNMINYSELSNITGFTFIELKKYLKILEETYVCYRMNAFHTNKRTELSKTPKIYFIDLGFRNVCMDNFTYQRTDIGAMHENIIFSELVKKDIVPKYWRTKSGAEVDFIIDKNSLTAIEVKTMLTDEKITRSFYGFIEKYAPKKKYIASLNLESKNKKTGIEFIPIVKVFGTEFK